MKTPIFATALLLATSALLAPQAHAQFTPPIPPGTTLNPTPNNYNLDLVSVDTSRYAINGDSSWPFYNNRAKSYDVSASAGVSSFNINYFLKQHRSATVSPNNVEVTSTYVHDWYWEGPNDPPAYQAVYEGSLGASIHFDSPTGQASFRGKLTHNEGSHEDSISQAGTGTTMMNHLATDIYWHEEGDLFVNTTVTIRALMAGVSIQTPGNATLAGPVVNNGDVSMSSGARLFYPAAETGPQFALDW